MNSSTMGNRANGTNEMDDVLDANHVPWASLIIMLQDFRYYYFLANMFTFTQQYFMKRLIDEDAILAQLEANKKKPAKPKSKFQKKLEEMQKNKSNN